MFIDHLVKAKYANQLVLTYPNYTLDQVPHSWGTRPGVRYSRDKNSVILQSRIRSSFFGQLKNPRKYLVFVAFAVCPDFDLINLPIDSRALLIASFNNVLPLDNETALDELCKEIQSGVTDDKLQV